MSILQATLYNRVSSAVLDGNISVTSAYIALVTDSYTPNLAHAEWADVSAYQISSTTGYTPGGLPVGGSVSSGVWDSADIVFTGLDATFAYGIIYDPSGLIGYVSFNAGNSISISGYDFEIRWSASGIITVEVS